MVVVVVLLAWLLLEAVAEAEVEVDKGWLWLLCLLVSLEEVVRCCAPDDDVVDEEACAGMGIVTATAAWVAADG